MCRMEVGPKLNKLCSTFIRHTRVCLREWKQPKENFTGYDFLCLCHLAVRLSSLIKIICYLEHMEICKKVPLHHRNPHFWSYHHLWVNILCHPSNLYLWYNYKNLIFCHCLLESFRHIYEYVCSPLILCTCKAASIFCNLWYKSFCKITQFSNL